MRFILTLIILAFTFPTLAADKNPAPASAGLAEPTWTIFCHVFTNPGHIQQAKTIRDKMVKDTGLKEWYIVSSAEASTLYFGYYTCIDDKVDAKEAAKAHKDLKTVAELKEKGQALFKPMLIPVEEADPTGKPEWDLKNARGYWTLQIAAYDDAQRKSAAVQSVINLRKEGIEAYYYHGPTISSICVGVFPESAATLNEGPKAGRDEGVLVTTVNLPDRLKNAEKVVSKDGKVVVIKQPKLVINDPLLQALKEKYNTHATNGVEGMQFKDKNGKQTVVYDSSFIVKIPQGENSVASAPVIPKEITSQLGGGAATSTPPATNTGTGKTPVTAPKNPVTTPKPPAGGKLPGIDF